MLDYDIDTIIVAEYKGDEADLKKQIKYNNLKHEKCNTIGSGRISIWSRYKRICPGTQNKYYSTQIFGEDLIVCGLHLMSDLYFEKSRERRAIIQELLLDVRELKQRNNTEKIMFIGDFNESPYSENCLDADTFHGLPVIESFESSIRKINGIEYNKYYNPMWNMFGDYEYPPGTYYWRNSSMHNSMWYILDQIIVSRELVPQLVKGSVKIITECSLGKLYDELKRPSKTISDHFPIMCEINEK